MSIYSLNGIEKKAYNNICDAIRNQDTHADIPNISVDKALDLYKKALSESISGYMYNQNQIQMRSSMLGFKIVFEKCLEVKQNPFMTDLRIIPEISDIMKAARKEKTVYEAIRSVYSYFVRSFDYAYKQTNDRRYHSAISVFLYRKSVCEGFALAFANVLNRLGIPCGIVNGNSVLNGVDGAHAWNIVELDRKYYHLDVTWDICTKNKGLEVFDYFFLDDQMIGADHQWNDMTIPYASDQLKEFYVNEGLYFTNQQECLNILVSELKKRKSKIFFRYNGEEKEQFVSMQNAQRLILLAASKCFVAYRSVSFMINREGGTICYSVYY